MCTGGGGVHGGGAAGAVPPAVCGLPCPAAPQPGAAVCAGPGALVQGVLRWLQSLPLFCNLYMNQIWSTHMQAAQQRSMPAMLPAAPMACSQTPIRWCSAVPPCCHHVSHSHKKSLESQSRPKGEHARQSCRTPVRGILEFQIEPAVETVTGSQAGGSLSDSTTSDPTAACWSV